MPCPGAMGTSFCRCAEPRCCLQSDSRVAIADSGIEARGGWRPAGATAALMCREASAQAAHRGTRPGGGSHCEEECGDARAAILGCRRVNTLDRGWSTYYAAGLC